MKIIIASRDRTADLGPDLKAGADARLARQPHPRPDRDALSLRDAGNEREFLERWTELVRRRSHADTLKVAIARKPGALGALAHAARLLLWKVLRYQHNGVVTLQNRINAQAAAALEFQLDELRRLRARVDELERRTGGGA